MKNKDLFKQKTVLITGASSGIGREFAFLFVQAGARVILTARRASKLEAVRDEVKARWSADCEIFPADLSDLKEAKRLAEQIDKAGLAVDVLVNNAGFVTYGYFHKLDIQKEIDEVFVNVVSVVYLTHHYLCGMVQRGRGWILNVSSTAALLPGCPFEAVYGASKSFLASFSQALAQEYRAKKIHVACLLPGNTDTDFWECGPLKRKFGHFRKSMLHPAFVARRGLEMLSSGKDFSILEKKTAFEAFLMKFLSRRFVSREVHRRHYDVYLED